LQYLRARYYNPALGAFTQMDPALGVVGGQSIRWNPYLYAGANPVNFVVGEFILFLTCLGRGANGALTPLLPA
jgi:hypothetical protein